MKVKLLIALNLTCMMLFSGCSAENENVGNNSETINEKIEANVEESSIEANTEDSSEEVIKEDTIIDNDKAIEIAKDYAMRMGLDTDNLIQLDLSFDEYIFEVESGGEGYLICVQMNGNVDLGDYNDYDFKTNEVGTEPNALSDSKKQELINVAINDISYWYDTFYTGESHLAYNDKMFIDFINNKVDWLNRNGISTNGVELCAKAGIVYGGN